MTTDQRESYHKVQTVESSTPYTENYLRPWLTSTSLTLSLNQKWFSNTRCLPISTAGRGISSFVYGVHSNMVLSSHQKVSSAHLFKDPSGLVLLLEMNVRCLLSLSIVRTTSYRHEMSMSLNQMQFVGVISDAVRKSRCSTTSDATRRDHIVPLAEYT